MKKMLLITCILFLSICFFANTSYSETVKQEEIDCEKALKEGYVFIPTTIPQECLQKKKKNEENPQITKEQTSKTKFSKVLNLILEE